MSYQIKVRVISVGEVMTFKSGFKIREVVGTDDLDMTEKYPQKIPFVMKGANVENSGALHEGDILNITFTIGGRSWQDKLGKVRFSPSITCNQFFREGGENIPAPEQAESKAPADIAADDLPF